VSIYNNIYFQLMCVCVCVCVCVRMDVFDIFYKNMIAYYRGQKA